LEESLNFFIFVTILVILMFCATLFNFQLLSGFFSFKNFYSIFVLAKSSQAELLKQG